MGEFTMPSLGADMEEGTLLEWLVAPGDRVHKGDLVAVIDTAKASVEIESFEDGVVDALLVTPGTTVPVGTPLARLTDPAAPQKPSLPSGSPAAGKEPDRAVPAQASTLPAAPPPVRKLAHQLGVDLSSVVPTGKGGRITHADVTAAQHRAGPRASRAPARVTPYARRLASELGVDLAALGALSPDQPVTAAMVQAATPEQPGPSPMRRTVAALVTRSKREIPHYYLSSTIDLERALDWMQARNTERPVAGRLVPTALLIKATALAAVEVPALNGYWQEDGFQPGEAVHLGVAVSLRGGGLVAPALHDAANLTLDETMARMRDLVTRARNGHLRRRELTEATLTVTALGDQGVEAVLGVIVPPQVALVGFGTVVRRPWAVGDLVGVRPLVTSSLSADHRATDGFTGSRFLAAINDHLQRPEDL